MRVLDACAAPGGKAAYAAELMGDRGLVVAVDQRLRGARTIAHNATRLAMRAITPIALDARGAAAVFLPPTSTARPGRRSVQRARDAAGASRDSLAAHPDDLPRSRRDSGASSKR
jgi:hypothetical protein